MRAIAAALLLTGCVTWEIQNREACVGEQVVAPGEVMLTLVSVWSEPNQQRYTLFFVGQVGDEYEFRTKDRMFSSLLGRGEENFRETDEVSISHVTIRLGGLTEAGELRYWVEEACPP